ASEWKTSLPGSTRAWPRRCRHWTAALRRRCWRSPARAWKASRSAWTIRTWKRSWNERPQRLRRHAAALVRRPRPPRPALAAPAQPVPHLAVGGDAAADPGAGGAALLRALRRGTSGPAGAGGGPARPRARAVVRARLLHPRAQPACRRAALH